MTPSVSVFAPAAWPPNYVEAFGWRQNQLLKMRRLPRLVVGAKEYYKTRPVEFIAHWCDTYDPRNAGSVVPTKIPFVLFPRQVDLVNFLMAMLRAESNGLVEKSRDMGATFVCAAFSVWLWLFLPGAAIGWGSRKESLVDKLGDPDSIFEKMRIILRGLPPEFLPSNFSEDDHMTYMRFINPENGSTITGESGDNIGRGGRKLIYFKDESAHYEHPESIEAALMENTRIQIDISSVSGPGTIFHRRREAGVDWRSGTEVVRGKTHVFVFDWRDHPAKTVEWYEAKKANLIAEGLDHVFAQEIDRDYSASMEGVLIPGEWVKACIDSHVRLGFDDSGTWAAGLDIADEGTDTNALVKRKGVVLKSVEEWGERDTGVTARKAITLCQDTLPISVQYDCIGVGAGVKSEINRLNLDEKIMPKGMRFVPWNAAAAPLNADKPVNLKDKSSPLNGDFFYNLKAQGWWSLRVRCEKTWRAVTEGTHYSADELISIDSRIPLLRKLEKELSQPTRGSSGRLKMVVNKTPEGMRSPNLGDAAMQCYWPAKTSNYSLDNVY